MQKAALDKMVENGRAGKKISVSRIMREVGYSEETAVVPGKLTESKGFKQLCDELGLTDNFLTEALVSDIKEKPGKRFKELELGFKVRGRLKDNESGGPTFNFTFLTPEQQIRVARRVQTGDTESEATPDRLLDSNESSV